MTGDGYIRHPSISHAPLHSQDLFQWQTVPYLPLHVLPAHRPQNNCCSLLFFRSNACAIETTNEPFIRWRAPVLFVLKTCFFVFFFLKYKCSMWATRSLSWLMSDERSSMAQKLSRNKPAWWCGDEAKLAHRSPPGRHWLTVTHRLFDVVGWVDCCHQQQQ